MSTSDERKKRLAEIEEEKQILRAEQELKNFKSNASRSRSITVGTAFGGVTEISMRSESGEVLWCLMQPVEVTELIHQLAGNIGCHIAIQPRKDFASWRAWKEDNSVPLLPGTNIPNHLLAFQQPPHPDDLGPSSQVGITPPTKADLKLIAKARNKNEQQPLAVEKTLNKRKPKRAPATT